MQCGKQTKSATQRDGKPSTKAPQHTPVHEADRPLLLLMLGLGLFNVEVKCPLMLRLLPPQSHNLVVVVRRGGAGVVGIVAV